MKRVAASDAPNAYSNVTRPLSSSSSLSIAYIQNAGSQWSITKFSGLSAIGQRLIGQGASAVPRAMGMTLYRVCIGRRGYMQKGYSPFKYISSVMSMQTTLLSPYLSLPATGSKGWKKNIRGGLFFHRSPNSQYLICLPLGNFVWQKILKYSWAWCIQINPEDPSSEYVTGRKKGWLFSNPCTVIFA